MAITFGSSLFNAVLGFAKLSTSLQLDFNKKLLFFYIAIVTNKCLHLTFTVVVMLNNLFIYMMVTTVYVGRDLESYTQNFVKVYKTDFYFITLVSMPLGITFLYIFQICFAFTSCVKKLA